ncbi:MAG TPA: ROK family protein [Terriglobia bacterium]|nr:ROK family protein [Terriglobia bacterium]
MNRAVLAADLGGTKIAAARVEQSGRITDRLVSATPSEGGLAVVDVLTHLLRRLPAKGVCALGVDVPGLAGSDGNVWAPNIPGWERMPLGRTLARRFRLPVLVESDRNAFVTGEAWLGSARHRRDVVFVTIGTGIGAGIISGGRLIRGHAELAGCLGWMATRGRYLPEYRAVGCLETHAAGPGIALAAKRVFGRTMDTREVVAFARRGNRRAREVIREAGRDLGRALANVVDLLNPEMIIVGGGAAAAGNLLLDPAREELKRWAQPLAARQMRIRRSRLGWRVGLLGIARLCFDRFQTEKGEPQ